MRPCNVGTLSLYQFDTGWSSEYKGRDCNMWMSEQPFSDRPERTYAIVRDPRTHTLSMYFHCTESFDHRAKRDKMPSLDEWLETYVDALNGTGTFDIKQKQKEANAKFQCYNPINFQSRWIGHNPEYHSNHNVFLPKESHYKVSPNDLRERFDVLGDQSQMDKTICMIHIRYTGFVHPRCDCTHHVSATNTTATDAPVTASTVGQNVTAIDWKGRVKTFKAMDHGVQNHGDTYETTPRQDEMIASLREMDIPLYKEAKKVFQEQVKKVEDGMGIKICDKLHPPDAEWTKDQRIWKKVNSSTAESFKNETTSRRTENMEKQQGRSNRT